MDEIFNAINNFFRQFLFEFAQCFLFVFDIVWECVKRVVTIDISSHLLPWFMLISLFIVMFLGFRLAKIFVKNMLDEEYRERFNFMQLIIKILIIGFAIGFIPIAFSYVSKTTSDTIENINLFIPTTENNNFELKPSTILLQVGRINTSNISDDLSPEINVSGDNFDINEKNENDEYIYFPNYTSLFLLIIESIAGCIIFVMTGIMIASRIFMITYKYILAPYPISGLIDNEDKSFSTWLKMLLGDFMMNFAQVYCVYLTLFLCNNASIQNILGNDALGICGKIIFFLGGLIAIMNLPSVIATIIGGNSAGALQSLQEVKSIMTMTSGLASGIGGATVGVAMGATGGIITGISNSYTATGKSMMSNVAGGLKSGLSGGVKSGISTAKTNFGGHSFGGGISKGATILKSGLATAKSNFIDSEKNNSSPSGNDINQDNSTLANKNTNTDQAVSNNNITSNENSDNSNQKNNLSASEFFSSHQINQSSFNKSGEKIYNDTLSKRIKK